VDTGDTRSPRGLVLLLLQPVGEQGVAAPCFSYAFYASCIHVVHSRHFVIHCQLLADLDWRNLPCSRQSGTVTALASFAHKTITDNGRQSKAEAFVFHINIMPTTVGSVVVCQGRHSMAFIHSLFMQHAPVPPCRLRRALLQLMKCCHTAVRSVSHVMHC